MHTQLQSRMARIENIRRNLKSSRPLPLQNSVSLKSLYDIDNEIDNIKTEEDAIALKNKLLSNMNQINSMYQSTDDYMIMDNTERRNLNIFQKATEIQENYEDKVINYIAAILDPEYNYNTGLLVKQPSLMNPPSVSIPIKTLTTIPSEGYSSICISWNPTMFCTSNMIDKIQLGVDATNQNKPIYANKICSVLYSLGVLDNGVLKVAPSSWNSPVYGIPDNLPEVGIAKARLVSSKIKISFRGPVLSQGGTVMAAATFQGPPGLLVNSPEDNSIITNTKQEKATWADLFKISLGTTFNPEARSPFEEKIISNGIWAKNINITKDANGISAIFIPTDPMDEIFCKPGTFYGENVDHPESECGGPHATTCLYSDKGARLNYLFNIQGIPGDNTNPITVETYTTWEVLPTNESASALRNSANNHFKDSDYFIKIKDVINKYMDVNTGIQENNQQPLNGILSKIWSVGAPILHFLSRPRK